MKFLEEILSCTNLPRMFIFSITINLIPILWTSYLLNFYDLKVKMTVIADIYQLYGKNITLKFSQPAICLRLRQENPVKHNYTLEQIIGKTPSVKLETINTQISRCESKPSTQNKFTEQVIFQT